MLNKSYFNFNFKEIMEKLLTTKNLVCLIIALLLLTVISPIFKLVGIICGAVLCFFVATKIYDNWLKGRTTWLN